MNDLLESYALLANAMADDPFLSLANAVAWLDPLWHMPDDYEYEEGNDLEMALHITRGVFPDIYAGAVEQIRAGIAYPQLDNYICAEISKLGIPLEGLDWLAYGIPMPAHGVELSESDFYASHPDLARILDLFGIQPDPEDYRVEIPDSAYTAGRLLANSLYKLKDERWQQVGWALAWLFSCTGNSLIDCADEALNEMQPLPWDEESVAFAREILAEAEGILKDINAGLSLLEAHPNALHYLSENVNRICLQLEIAKEKHGEPHLRIHWPSLDRGAHGATVADPELLQLRCDAA
ncbi:MAG: hypothetical protein ABI700_01045 [Chloroflexota bacterium]